MTERRLTGESWDLSLMFWGYELRGDILETSAFIVEGNDDFNGKPLWDHPEWLENWTRDGRPYRPAPVRALPYVGGGWA